MFLVRFPVFFSWLSAEIVVSSTEVRFKNYGRFLGGSEVQTEMGAIQVVLCNLCNICKSRRAA
jgi:hypothetical protein